METTPLIIKQLGRKLMMLEKDLTPKKVAIGFGGNGPILTNALDAVGIKSTCLHLANFQSWDQSDWKHVKETGGLEKLRQIFLEGDLIALVDWTDIWHAENISEGILEDIIKPSGRRDFMFFFDLGNPSMQTPLKLDEILDLISSFSFYGRTTLGLSSNEAVTIWSSLTGLTQKVPVEEAGRFIHYAMDVDRLLIHSVDKTIVFQRKDTVELQRRLVAKPKTQTGGGDNLNAGYMLGLLSGFSLEESMILGMAASGFYIEEGMCATLADIQRYLRLWREELKSKLQVAPAQRAA